MKSFEEISKFIEVKAAEHSVDDSDWEYEFIELEVFAAIIEFSLSEGFSITTYDLEAFVKKVKGTDEDEEEDEEKNVFSQMNEICEEMENLLKNGVVPEKTKKLYTLWQSTFWPDISEKE